MTERVIERHDNANADGGWIEITGYEPRYPYLIRFDRMPTGLHQRILDAPTGVEGWEAVLTIPDGWHIASVSYQPARRWWHVIFDAPDAGPRLAGITTWRDLLRDT